MKRQRFHSVRHKITHHKKLLKIAHAKLGKPRVVTFVFDRKGRRMATILADMIVVCRNDIWRGIVSIAEPVLNEAISRHLPVVLYVHEDNRFIKFDPQKVFDLNEKNVRDGVVMYHIRADLGTYL